jgi:Flp pilus assembly protein TadD
MPVDDAQDKLDREHWGQVEEAAELLAEQRFVEALVNLRSVLKASPKNPYAFNLLGTALYESNEKAAARDAYRAALHLSPSFLGARVSLSHVLRQLGDARAALVEAKAVLKISPSDPEALHATGLAHAALGEHLRAKQHLDRYLDTSPELEAQLEVRQVLEMLGISKEGEAVEFQNDNDD